MKKHMKRKQGTAMAKKMSARGGRPRAKEDAPKAREEPCLLPPALVKAAEKAGAPPKLAEARVILAPKPVEPILLRPRMAAMAPLPAKTASSPSMSGKSTGGRLRRSAMGMMALVALGACAFGVARKCASPASGDDSVDASSVDAGSEPSTAAFVTVEA
jgi:hypothetical protein